MSHQAVNHVLVEILNTLWEFFSTDVLPKRDGNVTLTSTCILTLFSKIISVPQTLILGCELTFLLDMLTKNARHCLCISLPGFCRFFKNSTKSLDTWSVSKLAWRLIDGLGVLLSWVSDGNQQEMNKEKNVRPWSSSKIYSTYFSTMHCTCNDVIPFLGGVRDEGLKNFFTVVTLRVFSLVFFSSNLEKGPREVWPECCAGDWPWDWVCTPWLLAYAASSSRCNLWPKRKTYYQFLVVKWVISTQETDDTILLITCVNNNKYFNH